MPYREEGETPSEPDSHPLDAAIWRALTSVQKGLAEGDARARRYPAAIAHFAATIDVEPASFQSLLALVGADDRIALFTTEEVEPPSAFSVMRRDSVDQMVLADADARLVQPGATIVALGVADVPEMLALASVTQSGPLWSSDRRTWRLHRNSPARRVCRHSGCGTASPRGWPCRHHRQQHRCADRFSRFKRLVHD